MWLRISIWQDFVLVLSAGVNGYLHCSRLVKLTVVAHVVYSVGSARRDKELVMLNLEVRNHCTPVPRFATTLWHCSRCDAFISIRSAKLRDEAFCPVCGDLALEFCGTLTNMPWIQFGDA